MQNTFSKKIESLLAEEILINEARKKELLDLALQIQKQVIEMTFSNLIFVCTHNSRRSQLSQIWFWKGLEYFQIKNISSYSGGTEATAFNHRMVDAMNRFGFDFNKMDETENPKYILKSEGNEENEILLFSKKYADDFNPQKDFIAVMVCDQADAECPLVFGAYSKFSLPYVDPKIADETIQETKSYDDKVVEIGREIIYLVKILKDLL